MSSRARPRTVMLVSNPCVNDSRVIRAAEVVSDLGHEVIVLAVVTDDEIADEHRNGVFYRRLPLKRDSFLYYFFGAPRPRSLPSVQHPVAPSHASAGVNDPHPNPSQSPAEPGFAVTQEAGGFRDWCVSILRRNQIAYAAAVATRDTARSILNASRSILNASRKYMRSVAIWHFGSVIDVNRLTNVFLEELVRLSPDFIHAHDLTTLPAANIAAERINAKVVYDSHELEVHRNLAASRLNFWTRRRIEGKHIRRAAAVVTVCDGIADHLAKDYGIPRPLVVMNAPNMARIENFDRDLRSDVGLAEDVPFAVYIGRITTGRGIEECVKALPHWPDGHIALVGPSNPPTVASALALARELNVADRLHVMPPVPPNSVTSYVRTADISLVAIQNTCLSYYYCLPNKLIESALAGLPIVASDFPELRRFVEISGAGIVMKECDPHDIARALSHAYAHRDELKSGPEQLERVEATYGWPTQKHVLERLYRSFDRGTAA